MTGNKILGQDSFESTSDASSVTQQCGKGTRTTERHISVIDTPGVLDTSTVKTLKSMPLRSETRQVQRQILNEVYRIFQLAPNGFDAIMLVVKYGSRFTDEDGQALRLLIHFLGKASKEYMILILTHGDQARFEAEDKEISVEKCIDRWISTLPEWVRTFVKDIKHRVVLFDNRLREDKEPAGYKAQLVHLIEVNSH